MKRLAWASLWAVMLVLAGCNNQAQINRQEASLRWEQARHKINFQMAKEQYDRGDYEGCIKQLNKIMTSDTPYAPAYLLAARVSIRQQDYAHAYDLIAMAIETAPESADGYQAMALLKEHENDLEGALEAMSKAFAYDVRNPEYMIYLAELQVRNGQPELALQTLQTAEKSFVTHIGVQSAAADLYAARGDHEAEINCLRRILRVDPEQLVTRRRLAMALSRDNQPHQAIPLLERCLKDGGSNDTLLSIRAALAECYVQLEKFQQAERQLLQLCKAQPGQAGWHYRLAEVQAAQGRDVQALERLAEVLQLSPDHGDAHALAGYLYFSRGELKMAEAHLAKAVDSCTEPQLAAIVLVRTLESLERPDEAREVWAEFGGRVDVARQSDVKAEVATGEAADEAGQQRNR